MADNVHDESAYGNSDCLSACSKVSQADAGDPVVFVFEWCFFRVELEEFSHDVVGMSLLGWRDFRSVF